MRVLVENVTGRFLYVDVEEEDATVGRLKRVIASEEAIQEQRMILVADGGHVMVDDKAALSQYGVREGSLVYLYFFPDGSTKWHRSYEDYLSVHDGDGDWDDPGAVRGPC